MNSLNNEVKVKNLEIKTNPTTTSLYNSIINNKNSIKIKLENCIIRIKSSSIQKIFTLNEENQLENILFIFDRSNLDYDNENEHNFLINSKELKIKNIISNKKSEYYIPYVFFIISFIIFLHLLTFVFSRFFIVNIYLINCVILSELFFSLGYFYYEKLNETECFHLHFKYVKPLHIYSMILILINVIILIFPLLSGNNLFVFMVGNKINFIVTYCLLIIPSFITNFYELYYLKEDNDDNDENDLKEVVTSELNIMN